MSLTNLALSGLNAAQNRLQTTGHNISNAATEGYSRQSVFVQTAGAQATTAGYVGRGAQAVTVYRAYDQFINRQLVQSETSLASAKTYQTEVTQVNNLFADRTTGVSPALQRFFEGVNAVASAPGDAAARQEMLGRANSLVTQMTDTHAFLDSQRANVNTQISTMVSQANSLIQRVHDINLQIVNAKASVSAHPPNDLLDSRDQMVRELSQMVGVTVFEQDDVLNLAVGNGDLVLAGGKMLPLVAMPSSGDPSRLVVGISSNGGVETARELSESSVKGGRLGGLLQYRTDILDAVQNDLGRLAVGLAETFNAIHKQGVDLSGNPGQDFFSVEMGKPLPSASTPPGTPLPEVTLADATGLTANDYRIGYNEDTSKFEISVLPNGKALATAAAGDSIEFQSLWVRESVRDGARCHTGIASIVVVSEVRGTPAPLSRRSAWRTLGAAALAIPLMLIAVIVVVCESSVTACQS